MQIIREPSVKISCDTVMKYLKKCFQVKENKYGKQVPLHCLINITSEMANLVCDILQLDVIRKH